MSSPLGWLRRSIGHGVLPWTRRELPGFGYLALAAGHHDERVWKGSPTVVIRGKVHGYLMRLDRADESQRYTWFLGRYYEQAVQELLPLALRTGDTFVDIGSNIGMIMLLAASRLKDGGLVLAFEPNPSMYGRLREQIELNGLDALVRTHPIGLGAERAELTLNIPEDFAAMASLGTPRNLPHWAKRREIKVNVERADRVIPQDAPGAMLVKIDVEGYERQVLEGLEGVLNSRRPAVLLECDDDMLRHAGSSEAEIWSLMARHGYRALEPLTNRGAGSVRLRSLRGAADRREPNMLWLFPGGEHERRLAALIDA